MSNPLDPGVPARLRKRGSVCKLCLCMGLMSVGLLLALLVYALGKELSAKLARLSHAHIYQNQTLDEVANRSNVVRPLIDEKQTFDIAVSVWYSENNGTGKTSKSAIYSDIVFRGLRLADKDKSKNLTYKLPVAIFNRLYLNKNELRGSFVLIPTSPSLLDQVTDFSTWRSEVLAPWAPVRSWPFPLGAMDRGPEFKSVADRALDSFGFSMPLLEFHEIASQCANSAEAEPASVKGKQSADEDQHGEDDQAVKIALGETSNGVPHFNVTLKVDDPNKRILKQHPFVVTRTQIRVVDETHIFNRKLYNQEHKKLLSTSSLCGQGPYGLDGGGLGWCTEKTYIKRGHWETRLELKTTNESQSEWAYVPYIGYAASAAGPKDLVPIPVTRENCTEWKNTTSMDPEFIEINWQLSYSGRSPLKYFAADQVPSQRVVHNETEYKKSQQHDSAELWNGLVGHRFHQDAHPRRRLFIKSLGYVLSLLATILDLSFWYTRTSTVGISISGTILQAVPDIIGHVLGAAGVIEPHMQGLERLVIIWAITVLLGFFLLTPLLMLKTVARLSFSWDSWIPSVSRASPNHRERASQRLDSCTSWVFQAAICLTLTATVHIFEFPFDYELIASLHPARVPTDLDWDISSPLIRIYLTTWFPLQLTGQVSQILLNHRSKTFSGAYKLTILIRCIHTVLESFRFLPFVVGRYDARPGLSLLGLVQWMVLGMFVWQAVVYPKVTLKIEQEDEDEE
ncbi:hypothetical protein FB45DRAFT_1007031 [Roridomyces roridus]|uniref:Uncharacterized protein n=1 Tax=Roridomyces roridus TaxID=1738132 RepID=A0AAD7FGN3_9AGAR|nr:hypothetical protein FB45DRAFT_1007031 [Roridomyces roridus]